MDIIDTIESAIAKKAILDGLRPIDAEHEQRIMQKFRLDWNYHSNHIEGNSLSYGETKALLLFNITAQGKPLKDHFEIKGHNEAIDWILDVIKGKHDLTEKFIRELHLLLLKEPYMSDAITSDGKPTKKRIEVGRYKSSPNHVKTVTGEIFYFATPEETPAKMNDLLTWYHEHRKSEGTNAIELAAEFHYRFIRIHPFDDGNGRLARILMNFILMQYEFPPVIIKTEDKQNYYRALQQADVGNIEPFIKYIAENLIYSLDIMIAGARGESIEEPDDLDKEIILLDQQINDTAKKIEEYKSIEKISNLIDTSISKILVKSNERLGKLSTYYKRTDILLIVDDEHESSHFDTTLQKSINYAVTADNRRTYLDLSKLSFVYNFNFLLPLPTINVTIASFKSTITIEFFAISYQISNSNGDVIKKHYNEELTDIEIDSIIKKEELRHKRYIAQKIKEAETTQ